MTIPLHNVTSELWDVLIVGAGPAGGLAALELARRGVQVLLVDKARFPRLKVCGCCLNGLALSILERADVGPALRDAGAVPLAQVHVQAKKVSARLPLPTGAALSREILDGILIEQAKADGAVFLPETEARLEQSHSSEWCHVSLHQHEARETVRCRVLLVADGLQGGTLRDEGNFVSRPSPGARVGAGLTVREASDHFQPGCIYLGCGRGGYVGVVGLGPQEWNLAAALDRDWLRSKGSVANVVEDLFQELGWPTFEEVKSARWRGTPSLTRNPTTTAGERWFVIGDASGYVEPFTGEGMAWALLSAQAITPLVLASIQGWSSEHARRWIQQRRELLQSRQRWCRWLAWALRWPTLLREGIRLVSWFPGLAQPFLRHVNRPASAESPNCSDKSCAKTPPSSRWTPGL